MIDQKYQDMGYGKKGITRLIDLLRDAGYRQVQTSVVLGDGGPLGIERIQSAAVPQPLRPHRQPKSAISSLLREFC